MLKVDVYAGDGGITSAVRVTLRFAGLDLHTLPGPDLLGPYGGRQRRFVSARTPC